MSDAAQTGGYTRPRDHTPSPPTIGVRPDPGYFISVCVVSLGISISFVLFIDSFYSLYYIASNFFPPPLSVIPTGV